MHLYICALQLLFSFFSNHFNQFSVVFYSTAPRPCIYSSTENSLAAAEKTSSAASLSLYRLVFAMFTAYLPIKLRRDPTPQLLQRSSKVKRRRTLQTFSEFPYSNALRWLLLYFATLTRSVAVALPPSRWPSGTQSPMSNRGTVHALTALPKNHHAPPHCSAVWFITRGGRYIHLWELHEGVRQSSLTWQHQPLHFAGPCHPGCRYIACKVEVKENSRDTRSRYMCTSKKKKKIPTHQGQTMPQRCARHRLHTHMCTRFTTNG